MNYHKIIIRHPKICGGEPVIKGTRVPLKTILASLAEGDSIDQIIAAFPTLKEKDVRAVIAFAAASAEEDLPSRPLTPSAAAAATTSWMATRAMTSSLAERAMIPSAARTRSIPSSPATILCMATTTTMTSSEIKGTTRYLAAAEATTCMAETVTT